MYTIFKFSSVFTVIWYLNNTREKINYIDITTTKKINK